MCFLFSDKSLMSDSEFEKYFESIIKEKPVAAVKTNGGIGVKFGQHTVYLSIDSDYAVINYYQSSDFSKTQRRYIHKKVKELIRNVPVKWLSREKDLDD